MAPPLNFKLALPLNLATTWRYRKNAIFAIMEFHGENNQERNAFLSWLSENLGWAVAQGHVHVGPAKEGWEFFDCATAKNTSHLFGMYVAAEMGCDMRKTCLVNLDGDNVFTEEWVLDAFQRAEEECQSLPEQWCRDVWGEGQQFNTWGQIGGISPPQAGLTAHRRNRHKKR